MARYELNEERNRVQIYFDGLPNVETRDRIKTIHLNGTVIRFAGMQSRMTRQLL